MVSLFEQVIVFTVVIIAFTPFISKAVRLASRTWDNREDLDPQRVRQVIVLTPVMLIIAFILVYAIVITILGIIVF